jgi:chromosome segregation ATPase
MPTEAVAKAMRLVQEAKQRKVQHIVVGLQDEIDDRRAEVKLTKQKLASINHELNTLRTEKAECEQNLADLKALQEHLSKDEYAESLSSLSGAINDYEKRIEEAYASFQNVTNELNLIEAKVGMLSDKKTSLKTDGSGFTTPSGIGEELMAAECRQELQDL